MKKLMIAAAIVCAAAMAQAAAVTWYASSGTVFDGYNNSGEGYEAKAQAGTLYIFNANASGVSQQALLNALLAGGDMTSIASMDSYYTSNGKMGSTAKKTLAADYKDFKPVRTTEDGDYADFFYAMLVDDNVFISETYNAAIQSSKDTALQKSLSTPSQVNKGDAATFTTGGWYSVVPEPTSGLLLLLGVAGLALRRRRA